MSDRVSRFIQHEIDTINLHLPRKVINLRQLSKLEVPGVHLRDGTFNEFDAEELDYINKSIPKQYHGHVLLPIIITRRRDFGNGAYVISGSDANLYLVRSIIQQLPSYDIWRLGKDKDFTIFKYHLKSIRKKLNTTTAIAFA